MPLDPNIILGYKPIDLPDPGNQLLRAMQIQHLATANQAAQLDYQQRQTTADETNKLRALFQDPGTQGLDQPTLRNRVMSVAPISGQGILKNMTEAQTAQAGLTGKNLENHQKQIQIVGGVLNSAAQAGPQAVMEALQKIPSEFLPDPQRAQLLTQFQTDPVSSAKRFAMQALSPDQQYQANQPKVEYRASGGVQVPVNLNPNAGPIGAVQGGQVLQGEPKIMANDSGVYAVNPDGSGGAPVPMTGTVGVVRPQPGPSLTAPPTGLREGIATPAPGGPTNWENVLKAGLSDPNPNVRAEAQARLKQMTPGLSQNWASGAQGDAPAVPVKPIPLGGKDYMAAENAKNLGAHAAAINQQVDAGRNVMEQISEFQRAMQNYQTGPGSATRLSLAQAAAAVGAPKSLVEGINRGAIADAQEIQKLTAQGAMQSLKQAMDGQGRIAQAEFKIFAANNPNISLDPNAIQKIQAFQSRMYKMAVDEQQTLADYQAQSGDPGQYNAYWSRVAQTKGYGVASNITPKGGTPTASTNGWSATRVN